MAEQVSIFEKILFKSPPPIQDHAIPEDHSESIAKVHARVMELASWGNALVDMLEVAMQEISKSIKENVQGPPGPRGLQGPPGPPGDLVVVERPDDDVPRHIEDIQFNGDTEDQRVITVRLPESAHAAISEEAAQHRTSVNRLCIAKILSAFPRTTSDYRILDEIKKEGVYPHIPRFMNGKAKPVESEASPVSA